MSLLDIFRTSKKTSANIAKDRLLQLIVDRRLHSKIGLLNLNFDKLQRELLEVISRHLPIKGNQMKVEVERDENGFILELNVLLPEQLE